MDSYVETSPKLPLGPKPLTELTILNSNTYIVWNWVAKYIPILSTPKNLWDAFWGTNLPMIPKCAFTNDAPNACFLLLKTHVLPCRQF